MPTEHANATNACQKEGLAQDFFFSRVHLEDVCGIFPIPVMVEGKP